MPPLNLRSALEALLFSSDQPLTLAQLSDALESPAETVTESLGALGDEYRAREAGIEVREMAGGWIIMTTQAQHEWVGRMLRGKRKMRLSRAALETLAIIAYKQPVTKSEIEAIRGVDSSGTLATLLERSLVTIKGRSTVVGRPLLYGSTDEFLNYFGLRDLAELPRPEELRALVAAREPEQMEMLEVEATDENGALLAGAVAAGMLAAAAAEAGSADREPVSEAEVGVALLEPPVEETVRVVGASVLTEEELDALEAGLDEPEDDLGADEDGIEADVEAVGSDLLAASDEDDDDSDDDEDEYDDDDEFEGDDEDEYDDEDEDDEDSDDDGEDDDDRPSAHFTE